MGLHDDPTLPPLRRPEEREVRASLRALILVGWVVVMVVFAFALASLAGCAQRNLTAQQDRDLYEQCKATGCRVVPMPVWREIERYFRNLGPMPAPAETS